MFKSKDEELRRIQKKFILTSIIGAPGGILVAFGLYGIFGANGDAFIAILNDRNYAEGFVVAGGLIMLWQMITVVRLVKRRSEIEKRIYR
jgi:hypothetical protein